MAKNKKDNERKLSHHEIQKINRKKIGKQYYKGGVFEPGTDYEDQQRSRFEDSIRVEIEKSVKDYLRENEEEFFFQFVKRQTGNFERLLDDYDTFINQGLGMRGKTPKIPQTPKASEYQDKMMKIINELNSQRYCVPEEIFLDKCSKSIPNIEGVNKDTLKRIIDERRRVIKRKKLSAKVDMDFEDR